MSKVNFVKTGLLLLIFTFFGCKSNLSLASENAELKINRNLPTEDSIQKESDLPVNKSNNFFVILGVISVENEKIKMDNPFWGHFDDEEEAKFYPDNKVELDIVNCAGYIASAATNYKTKSGMREVKIIAESIVPDAVSKIKQCFEKPNDKIIISDVFGITPRADKRKDIKIKIIDTKKLYDSLIKDIAEMKKVKKSEENTEPQFKGTKGNLKLGDDNWTDLDGDGQIDLIKFHDTHCDEKDTCTWIFRLINGKWKEINYVYPL